MPSLKISGWNLGVRLMIIWLTLPSSSHSRRRRLAAATAVPNKSLLCWCRYRAAAVSTADCCHLCCCCRRRPPCVSATVPNKIPLRRCCCRQALRRCCPFSTATSPPLPSSPSRRRCRCFHYLPVSICGYLAVISRLSCGYLVVTS